jgi:hypothetical protein
VIYDLIMLRGGEDDQAMLEVRLNEFADLDCRHVISEATCDHRGNPKPLWLERNFERFIPGAHRIMYVPVTDLPADEGAWAAEHGGWAAEQLRRGPGWVREHIQRDRGWAAVKHMAADSDVILISDLDEFPSREALEGVYPVAALSQRLCMYAVDWLVPQPHLCSVAASGRYMRGRRPSEVRDGRYGYYVLENAGWHLTWLGGVEGQRAKLEATCHTEMRPDEIARIASGACYEFGVHHAGDLALRAVDVDETWPRWIYERKCPASWFRPRETA